ncbi:sensor histidine kinase [Desulfosporosinus sp. FKA]|uniref:sensor histidine kinase n=1 Tax=Desulfosporosinus sp. FKA TaxID=1969834 RepID=UPI000B4A4748|nr:sensor histidine kinase [Desulfosporosinus sp. FKA]
MRIKEYLADRIKLFIFYIVLMGVISAVMYLNGAIKIGLGNIIYINSLGLTLFLLYLLYEYLPLKKYYGSISCLSKYKATEIINNLPKAKSHEQTLWTELLIRIDKEHGQRFQKFKEEKRESSEFVTTWVHEVKTPIAVSRLLIENSRDKFDSETLRSIEEEVDKIDNFVEKALYYSKIDDFSKDYFVTENNIEQIVKEVVKKNAKTFINKRITIKLMNLDVSISTDKKWLMFLIDQVLANALKYTDEGGKIIVSTETNSKEDVLIIEDNGIGIKEEDMKRVFDRGFTGYNGRNEYKSTGMGLYLAKKLAAKLGHDITVESVYGKYTRVKIRFPKLMDYFNVT